MNIYILAILLSLGGVSSSFASQNTDEVCGLQIIARILEKEEKERLELPRAPRGLLAALQKGDDPIKTSHGLHIVLPSFPKEHPMYLSLKDTRDSYGQSKSIEDQWIASVEKKNQLLLTLIQDVRKRNDLVYGHGGHYNPMAPGTYYMFQKPDYPYSMGLRKKEEREDLVISGSGDQKYLLVPDKQGGLHDPWGRFFQMAASQFIGRGIQKILK
jgi:hypothetical protein